MWKPIKIALFIAFGLFILCCQNGKQPIASNKYKVYFFASGECPLCKNYLPVWKKTHSDFADKFDFCWVRCNANAEDSWQIFEQEIPIKKIENYTNSKKFSDQYKILVIPSVLVTTADGKEIYRGATDDRVVETGVYTMTSKINYLREVLNQLKDGKNPAIRNTKTAGCYIE